VQSSTQSSEQKKEKNTMSTKNTAVASTVTVTKIPEGVSGKAKAKRVAKEKAPKPHEVEGFDPMTWDGVKLKEGVTYYVVRSREEIPGITDLDVAQDPVEVIEAKFLLYSPKAKEYAFDDGRLMKSMVYLAVPVTDRTEYIHANTPAGKKAANVFVTDWRNRHQELIAMVRGKDAAKIEEAASDPELTLREVEVMGIAVGAKPEDLVKAGKARAKKVAVIMKAREAWLAAGGAAKKPIPERSTTKK
jgi:hypothetical protein